MMLYLQFINNCYSKLQLVTNICNIIKASKINNYNIHVTDVTDFLTSLYLIILNLFKMKKLINIYIREICNKNDQKTHSKLVKSIVTDFYENRRESVMKIKIHARFLQNMLKKAKGLQLNKLSPDLEFQRGLLIKDNRLIMNNLKTQLESKFHIDVLEPGQTLIPEQTLKMLENFKDGELIITDNEITHGTRKLKFMPGDIEQFSVINNEISEELFTISETELSHLLEVNYATINDDSRPVLKGIEIKDNKFAALNGYYLSLRQGNFNCNEQIIISQDVWKVLLKTIDKKSDAQVKVFWNGSNLVKFEFEDFIVKGNLYNDKFFDVEKVIYDNPETEFIISGDKLHTSLKLMDKLTKDEQVVLLYINNDKLKLETKTDMNIMTDEINITDKYGPDVNIAFDIKFLLAVVNQYKNENVRAQLKGPNDPMILKGHDKLDLVLPVRLREW